MSNSFWGAGDEKSRVVSGGGPFDVLHGGIGRCRRHHQGRVRRHVHRTGDDLHQRRPRRVQDGRGEDQREGRRARQEDHVRDPRRQVQAGHRADDGEGTHPQGGRRPAGRDDQQRDGPRGLRPVQEGEDPLLRDVLEERQDHRREGAPVRVRDEREHGDGRARHGESAREEEVREVLDRRRRLRIRPRDRERRLRSPEDAEPEGAAARPVVVEGGRDRLHPLHHPDPRGEARLRDRRHRRRRDGQFPEGGAIDGVQQEDPLLPAHGDRALDA